MAFYLKERNRISVPIPYMDFVEQMSIFSMDAEVEEDYLDRLKYAIKTAKETDMDQVICGDSSYALVITRMGNASWYKEESHYVVLTEEQLFDFEDETSYGSLELDTINPNNKAFYKYGKDDIGTAFKQALEMLESGKYENVKLWRLTINGREEIRNLAMREFDEVSEVPHEDTLGGQPLDTYSIKQGQKQLLQRLDEMVSNEGKTLEEAVQILRTLHL